MGVDAAGGRQHAPLGGNAQGLQRGEVGAPCPGGGDVAVVAAQREQAAHEGGQVHVLVAAAVQRADPTGVGMQGQLGVKGADRRAPDGGHRPNGCNGQRMDEGKAHAGHSSENSAATAARSRNVTSRGPLTSSLDERAASSRQATAPPSGSRISPSRRGLSAEPKPSRPPSAVSNSSTASQPRGANSRSTSEPGRR